LRLSLAWGIDALVGEYLSAKFPELCGIGPYKPHVAVGLVSDDGVMVGGLGLRMLNSFDGSMSIHIEPGFFFTSDMIRELCRRAFIEARIVRLTCHVRKRTMRARRLAEHFGFKLEGVKRRGYDGVRDACVYGMLAEDCPWLEGKENGRTRSPRPLRGGRGPDPAEPDGGHLRGDPEQPVDQGADRPDERHAAGLLQDKAG
jgi:hypothetical protein